MIRILPFLIVSLFSLYSYSQEFDEFNFYEEKNASNNSIDSTKSLLLGSWSLLDSENEISISDSTWVFKSADSTINYKYQLKSIVEETNYNSSELLITMCRRCKSYTGKNQPPDDEIILYTIESIDSSQMVLSDFPLDTRSTYIKKKH